MKQSTCLISAVLALLLLCSGCAASAKTDSSFASSANTIRSSTDAWDESATEDFYEVPASESPLQNGGSALHSEKEVYSASADIQTLTFEDAAAAVPALAASFGGFLASSSVTGLDYYTTQGSYQNLRSASYTLRIPSERFPELQEALSSIGNVTRFSSEMQNITTQYYDTQCRLDAYRTELARLQALLEKSETVEDMITIESRLAEVQYEIDALTSVRNQYDAQVAYSTVELYLQEVSSLSDPEPAVQSYGQRLKSGFTNSLKAIGRFFQNLFVGMVTALPYLALTAVLAVIIVPIVLAIRRRKKRGA